MRSNYCFLLGDFFFLIRIPRCGKILRPLCVIPLKESLGRLVLSLILLLLAGWLSLNSLREISVGLVNIPTFPEMWWSGKIHNTDPRRVYVNPLTLLMRSLAGWLSLKWIYFWWAGKIHNTNHGGIVLMRSLAVWLSFNSLREISVGMVNIPSFPETDLWWANPQHRSPARLCKSLNSSHEIPGGHELKC